MYASSSARNAHTPHIIYRIKDGKTGKSYVGVTVKRPGLSVSENLKIRMQKHFSRAKKEGKDWSLCRAVRRDGRDSFSVRAIKTVGSKKAAHLYERGLTKRSKPDLNTL